MAMRMRVMSTAGACGYGSRMSEATASPNVRKPKRPTTTKRLSAPPSARVIMWRHRVGVGL
eukprot:2013044-Prymnesium_polylepis.2